MYNSTAGSNQDDADSTMIDPSYLYGNNDGPTSNSVVRRLQKANQSTSSKCTKNRTNFDDRNDYVYIEHDRLEAAKQIEQILNFYRQDLKQESNTQLDCNQQLITRLIDFLRPVFSTDETKMKDLDTLYEEISDSQDIRFIDQKEKMEQLNNEIIHLKKLIITSPNEGNRNNNPMTKVYQINSMVNYEQWTEMEEETKKLHNLVETQRNKINELIKLIFQEDEPSTDDQQPTTTNPNRQPSGTVDNNQKRPPVPARKPPLLSRISSYNDIKNCPICKYKFPRTATEFEIDEHMDECLSASNNLSTRSEQHACPYCEQQFPANDKNYIQHLTDCLNERAHNF